MQEMQAPSLSREDPWRRKWQPNLVFLPWKSHGQRSLVGYSPWGCQKIGRDLLTKQQNCEHYFQPQRIRRGFFFLAPLCILHDLSSPIRGRIQAPSSRSSGVLTTAPLVNSQEASVLYSCWFLFQNENTGVRGV